MSSDPGVLSPGEARSDLRDRAVGAVKWSAASRAVVQVVQFAGTVCLARLVLPSDFGLAALVLVVSNFALLLSDLGLGAVLVHGRELTREKLDTAFWVNALVGFALTLVVAGLAWPLSVFYHQPRLVGLFLVASVTYTLALTVVPLAILERELNLRPAAVAEVVAACLGWGVGVIAALLGAGAYAVVLVPLVNVTASSVLYGWVTRYRPHSFISKPALREIWSYSRGLVGFNFVNYFTRNSDDILLGRFSTPAALGFYSRAYLIMLLPVWQIQTVIGRVLFPALAKLRDDAAGLVAAHRKSLVLSSAICAPLAAGAASCSHDFVLVVFGPRWSPMIPMVAILSVAGVQQIFAGTVGSLFQVTGRTGLMFRWNILFTALTLIAFAIGIHWGALGMCWAVFVRGWALLPIMLLIPLHLIGETLRAISRALAPVAISLVIEATAVLVTFFLTRNVIASPVIRLILQILAGSAGYLVALRLVARPTFSEIFRLLRRAKAPA